MFIHVITGGTTDPAELKRLVYDWADRFGAAARDAGWIGATCGISPEGRFVEVARFASEEAADAVRQAPEIDEWKVDIQKLYTDLELFHDAVEIQTMGGGAREDAGFVQVMRGRVVDPERLAALRGRLAEFETVMATARPDVLGEIFLLHADGTFTQAVYFTSEADARRNEAAPLPPEAETLMREMMSAVEVTQYIDLPDPWHLS